MKLHVGDEVIVTIGKDKGQKGKIEKVFPKAEKVVVPGVNIYKRTRRGLAGEKGGVFELVRPLSTAKVALICPNCSKPTRVSYQIDKKREKVRICAKCKREITAKKEKKK